MENSRASQQDILMDHPVAKIREFVAFVRQHLTGDEKGEAQIFCDALFQAFGHAGVFEAGGNLEYRVHKGKTTRFADLLWRPRLLLENEEKGRKAGGHSSSATSCSRGTASDIQMPPGPCCAKVCGVPSSFGVPEVNANRLPLMNSSGASCPGALY